MTRPPSDARLRHPQAGDESVEKRRCRKCREWKPLAEFRDRPRKGRSSWCTDCADGASRRQFQTYRLGASTAIALRVDPSSPLLGLACSVCAGELLTGDAVVLEEARFRVRHEMCR